jgi:FlaA1/EpsC-like NDP-sugar epimerase
MSLIAAYYLRFNFSIPENEKYYFLISIFVVLAIRGITFSVGKVYAGMVRFTGKNDIIRILIILLIGSILLTLMNFINLLFNGKYLIPISVIIIEYFITAFILSFSRLLIKTIYLEYNSSTAIKGNFNVLIYGTGESALTTKKALMRETKAKHKVLGFLDHHKEIVGRKIDGIKVYYYENLASIIKSKDISMLIISKKGISVNRKKFLVDICLQHNVEMKVIPDLSTWISNNLNLNQLKNIKIEDLLERSEIKINKENIVENLYDKTILVTGAAGSIGSEIVRQLTKFFPKKIILFDIAETPIYEIELEIREELNFSNIEVVIGDVRDKNAVKRLFKKYKPDYVFHAAAYKHVPLMENNPIEAVKTNIIGSRIVADAAVNAEVSKFVMISTDKAVNPTNVMGASKRVAEIYVQSLSEKGNTKFITTRFGNVLGSSGSVIPRFRKQIEAGGPITVTHPEVTRYFMTIPEACQLVLEAGNMGKNNEIFIFDMGEPVKIIHLAQRMILLSGLKPEKDIQIKITGLRPGEKLYEELLANKENTLPTYNPQIMIAKVEKHNFNDINNNINDIIKLLEHNDYMMIVKKIKEIVPEYKSSNSIFNKLDKK